MVQHSVALNNSLMHIMAKKKSTQTSTQITTTIIHNHTLWTKPKNKTIKKGKFDVAYEDKN
jgi:hypothetical protein